MCTHIHACTHPHTNTPTHHPCPHTQHTHTLMHTHNTQDHREAIAPVVVQLLQAADAACPPGVLAEQLPGARVAGVPEPLLLKEAVYSAVAVGAYDLHDSIDYTPWLRSSLLKVRGVHAVPISIATAASCGFGIDEHLQSPQ